MNLRFAMAISLLVWLLGWPIDAAEPLTLDPIIATAEQSRIDAIARASESAVSVYVPGGGGGGSAVMISPDGYALTNFHVTSPAGSYMRCSMNDGNVYETVLVGIDPVGDLALIRLLGRDDFPFAEMGDSRTAQVGDWCMVIGNPFLLSGNLQPTVTYGILSGVGRYQYPSGTLLEYGDCLQTDASINPGNSGGPIYDSSGRLIGIVGRASFEKRGRVNVGVGYAISIQQAKNFLGYLHSGRVVDHATLGATVTTDPDGGAIVSNILESSDAYRRGLRYGSEILEIDGRVVRTANDVQNVLATFPSGWRVKMIYRERQETRETLVRLMSVHRPDELLEKMAGALPPPPPRPPEKSDPDQDEDGQEPNQNENPHGSVEKGPAAIPDAVADQLVKRTGFANYHFNLVRQDRFIESLRAQFPAVDLNDVEADDNQTWGNTTWVIDGETDAADSEPVRITIGDGAMAVIVGDRPVEAEANAHLYDAVISRSVAGILPALDAWRRMLAVGPRKFGESYYLGTMPLGGQRPLRDCMVGIRGELEYRWLRHPESGLVEAIEVLADRDTDPAELWLFRDDAEESMPSVIELRYGTDPILRFRVKSWQALPAAETNQPDTEET